VIQKTRPQRSPRRPALPEAVANRLPPGQFFTPRWPVLHQGDVPPFDPATWDFRVWGLVRKPAAWDWNAFQRLPRIETAGDLHCVTRWSSLDHLWQGVAPGAILDIVGLEPEARFVLLHGEGGYSANLPLAALLEPDVVLATQHRGEPLTPEHGAPLRAVIPGRYAWKSVKWLRGIEVLAEDRPGFWEVYGYSNAADSWREERFAS
jgi:DMSO/TMAO reductase YedYZ molybdopterin-dependent catalytic subunit